MDTYRIYPKYNVTDITIVFIDKYNDGPVCGLVNIDREVYFFKALFAAHPDLHYVMYQVSPTEIAELYKAHDLWEMYQYSGEPTEQWWEKWHKAYPKPLDYSGNKIVGWFEL